MRAALNTRPPCNGVLCVAFFRCDFYLVAAAAFCGIEGLIGSLHEFLKGRRILAAKNSDSATFRDRNRLGAKVKFASFPFLTYAVDRGLNVLRLDVRDHEEEFVAAHPSANVGGPRA